MGILTKNSLEKSNAPHMPGVPPLGLNIDRCINDNLPCGGDRGFEHSAPRTLLSLQSPHPPPPPTPSSPCLTLPSIILHTSLWFKINLKCRYLERVHHQGAETESHKIHFPPRNIGLRQVPCNFLVIPR